MWSLLATLVPSIWKAEVGESVRVRSKPGLHIEFQVSLGYRQTEDRALMGGALVKVDSFPGWGLSVCLSPLPVN